MDCGLCLNLYIKHNNRHTFENEHIKREIFVLKMPRKYLKVLPFFLPQSLILAGQVKIHDHVSTKNFVVITFLK